MGIENPWDFVTLKLWYGGSFRKGHLHLVYGSRCFRTVGVDPDELCWFTLLEEAERCGGFRRNVDAIFYMKPDVGLVKVENDKDVGVMTEVAVGKRVVGCYLVVDKDIPEVMVLVNDSLMEFRTVIQLPSKLTPRRKEENKGTSVNATIKKGPQMKSSSSQQRVNFLETLRACNDTTVSDQLLFDVNDKEVLLSTTNWTYSFGVNSSLSHILLINEDYFNGPIA